jgi:hypothetical protein
MLRCARAARAAVARPRSMRMHAQPRCMQVSLAACWLAMNLTHVEQETRSGSGGAAGGASAATLAAAAARARQLDAVGVLAALRSILDLPEGTGTGSAELQPRARNAVKQMEALLADGGWRAHGSSSIDMADDP